MTLSQPPFVLHAPPQLWAAARALIVTIFNLFGAPEKIAAQHTHSLRERSLILTWLRAGEAMIRHLLLIEAAACAKPALAARKRVARVRERKQMEFAADAPETWRVSFRCFVSSPARGGSVSARHAMKMGAAAPSDASGATSPARGGGKRDKRFFSAWPLAERAEAMLRVFNNPAPFAQRLARRLMRAPARVGAVVRVPENLQHAIAEDDYAALCDGAETARKRFEPG
jgi:hypothetical protein